MRALRGLLEEPAPFLNFVDNYSGINESSMPIQPLDVQLWTDFVQTVLQFPVDDTAVIYQPCIFTNSAFPRLNEADTAFSFKVNFALRFEQCGVDILSEYNIGVGVIDLLLRRNMIKLPCEFKFPRSGWPANIDLIQQYRLESENRSIIPDDFSRIIRQIYGYMVRLNTRYGVISTYRNTWFVRRQPENQRILEISKCFNHDAVNPSVPRCLWYLINQGDSTVPLRLPEELIPYIPPPPSEPSSSTDSSAGCSSDSTFPGSERGQQSPLPSRATRQSAKRKSKTNFQKNLQLSAVDLVDRLKESEGFGLISGNWKGKLCSVVFLKDQDRMDRIVSALESAKSLEGTRIPRMFASGKFNDHFVVIVEPIEPITAVECLRLGHNDKMQIMAALRDVHRQKLTFSDGVEDLTEQCIVRAITAGEESRCMLLPVTGLAQFDITKRKIEKDSTALNRLLYGAPNLEGSK